MAIVKISGIQKSMRRLFLVKDYKRNSGFRYDAPEKLKAYLKQHNKKSTGLLGINKTIRYTEGVIELNEPIPLQLKELLNGKF
ncbi:hypothetical protein GCM10023314_09050 [Algibacter agarivorans]|uniref:Uncharacterized protein n=1 Tax=Algibacter agarivorans TaxID=1109741 RepID=A0ABP9GD64_9FLAO